MRQPKLAAIASGNQLPWGASTPRGLASMHPSEPGSIYGCMDCYCHFLRAGYSYAPRPIFKKVTARGALAAVMLLGGLILQSVTS